MRRLTIAESSSSYDLQGPRGIVLDVAAKRDDIQLTGIRVAALKRGITNTAPIQISCYVCAPSNEEPLEPAWRLLATREVKHATRSRLGFSLCVPCGETRQILIFCETPAFICSTGESTEHAAPVDDGQCSIQCVSSSNSCVAAGVKLGSRTNKALIGSVDYCPRWEFDRVLFLGWMSKHHSMSKISADQLAYILHLSKVIDTASHDDTICEVCSPWLRCIKTEEPDEVELSCSNELRPLWRFLSHAEKMAHLERHKQQRKWSVTTKPGKLPPWAGCLRGSCCEAALSAGAAVREARYQFALGRAAA